MYLVYDHCPPASASELWVVYLPTSFLPVSLPSLPGSFMHLIRFDHINVGSYVKKRFPLSFLSAILLTLCGSVPARAFGARSALQGDLCPGPIPPPAPRLDQCFEAVVFIRNGNLDDFPAALAFSHIEQVSCVRGEGFGNVANTLQERGMVELVFKLSLKGAIGWEVK
jgi:hypothetical protein